MKEYEMCPVESVIESIDRVFGQLGHTPWAFRLEEDGTLRSDPNCCYFRDAAEETEEHFEELEKRMLYQQRMWKEYKEVFSLSPFVFADYEEVQGLDWLDILSMPWAEIADRFLIEELPLIRAILKTDGYWHKPVPETISDEALNQLVAFRYKERLITDMDRKAWGDNPTESEEFFESV